MSNAKPEPALLFTDEGGELLRRKWELHVISGADAGKSVTLASNVALIGAAPAAALTLVDDTVSRYHLEIDAFADGLRLRDLDSTNGSYLGDERIKDAFIEDGQIFRVGETQIRAVAQDEKASSEVRTDPSSVPPGGKEFVKEAVGVSQAIRVVFQRLRQIADSPSPVLFLGEQGSGRAECGRVLHEIGARSEHPLVRVRLKAGSTAEDADAVFFGIAGPKPRRGALERAANGTLLIENLDSIPIDTQRKLAKAIEQGDFHPTASQQGLRLHARLVATAQASFTRSPKVSPRLARRLAVIRVAVPPLRERPDDAVALAELFLAQAGCAIPLGARLRAAILDQSWPRNGDALRQTIRDAYLGTTEANALAVRFRTLLLTEAVEREAGDVSEAARGLGMSARSVWNHLGEEAVELDML